jgi:hypothetical protein
VAAIDGKERAYGFPEGSLGCGIKGKERKWCSGWVEMVTTTVLMPPA